VCSLDMYNNDVETTNYERVDLRNGLIHTVKAMY